MRKVGPGRYEKLCIGTTTSARMVRFTEPLGAQYGVRAICGKGGFPDEAIEPMPRLGMVYFAIVGGAAALETTQIEEIEEVAWEELMPECLWRFRVKDFGPLTVGIDAHGRSLYHEVQAEAQKTTGGDLCPALTDSTTASSTCRSAAASRASTTGSRHVIDKGLDLRDIEGLFETAGAFVDIVKLGWGTAYITEQPQEEDRALPVVPDPGRLWRHPLRGGLPRGRIDEYKPWLRRASVRPRRDLRRDDRDAARAQARADRRLRRDFTVLSEVGSKDDEVVYAPVPVGRDGSSEELDAGAWKVITEGREGGTAGHLPTLGGDAHRARRRDRRTHVPLADLIFEAPTKASQAWFIRHFGPNVNLGNIPPDEVIPLETLRLGLRGDTLKEVLLGGARTGCRRSS